MSQTGVTDVGWRRHAWRNGAVETLGIAVRAYRRALAQSRKRLAPSSCRTDRAERGRPELRRFEADAWNAGALTPLHPISASLATCDTDFPQIRFLMDPDPPVTQATRRIR